MAWADVDAVRILEECSKLCNTADVDAAERECAAKHCEQCINGPDDGRTTDGDDDVDLAVDSMVLDDDDVFAAMQCIA